MVTRKSASNAHTPRGIFVGEIYILTELVAFSI